MSLTKPRQKSIALPEKLEAPIPTRTYFLMKRVLDFLAALIGLILLSPVFLIVSILIKWEDPEGPVLFKQLRVGESGRTFYMYKFRSMVFKAEEMLDTLIDQNEVEGPMFKMKRDPRITKVGHWIRRTSIDEFPQLINVLKGEMSLVGPRPPLPREVIIYSNYDMQRLLIRPGCTGMWQVSGRSNVSFKEMVQLDLYYIQHRSLKLDMKLMFKTFYVVVSSKDGY
ncbi:sugar transferase [Halobacillus sp. BAB-2008]|uniref:sugar transferase n=1 Tax=Halobacillus sp. BAB-2008 TaxID=1246484 RepID=UPI0002A4DC55|nr:sugar transferase [Halobacillus sp. BAB-2008]ELK48573.1 sugar transferase [Halobacillus sp. BAB-2008]